MSTTFMDIGSVPGVHPPPLYPENPSEPLPLRIVIGGNGAAAVPVPVPVLALTNFPENSDCAQVLGSRLAGELACKLTHEGSKLLFGLSRPACEILKTCTEPARRIAVIAEALLPLTAEEAGQVLLALATGGGSLNGNGIHDVLCAMTPVAGPLNGRGIRDVMALLMGPDGITPREFADTMDRLLTGPDPALTLGILLGLGFLRTQLSKRDVFDVIHLLAQGPDGIGGASIVLLVLTLCTGETTFRLADFKALVTMLCLGPGKLSGKKLKELTTATVGSKPSDAPRLKSALEKLAPLQPVEMLKVCNSLLAPVPGYLAPEETLTVLLGLCHENSGLGPRDVRELVLTLVLGDRKLTPTQFQMLLRRAVIRGGERIIPADVLELVRMLVKANVEPLPRTDLLWLFDTFTGDTKLTPKQLHKVLKDLSSGNWFITPAAIRRMAGWFETAPLHFHLVVTELGTLGFTPRQTEQLTRWCCTPLAGVLGGDVLVTTVKALRPMGGGIAVTDLLSLFEDLCGAVANPLTPVQFVEAMAPLCIGMAPTRILDLKREYIQSVIQINPVQFHQLVRNYTMNVRGSVTATEFTDLALDLVMALNGKLNATQAFTLMTKLCPNAGLAADKARLALVWLRTTLTPTQVYTLVDSLLGFAAATLTSTRTEAVIVRLKNGDDAKNNGLTPTEAQQLVVSLLAGPLSVVQLEQTVVTLKGQPSNGAQFTISPRFLYRCSQEAGFAGHVSASLGGASPLDLQNVVHLLALGQDYVFTPAQMRRIFELFTLHFRNFATYDTIRRFLKEAKATGASWTDVFKFLDRFVAAQRSPFGVNTVLAPAGVGGAVVVSIVRMIRGWNVTIEVTQGRINHFCNAHTYRHFDFSQYDRAAQISFFPPATTAAGMILVVQNAINSGTFDVLIGDAMNRPGVFTRTSTFGGNTDTDDGGTYYNPGTFQLQHYHPAGDAISKDLLKAFKKFFGL